jgi:membrane-bound lytic murein transglycosylase
LVGGLFGAILFFATAGASVQGPLQLSGTQLEPVKWSELAGWRTDDHLAAFAAYQASCQALRKARRSEDRGQISGALWNVCRNAVGLRPQDADTARAFFEQNFLPVRISRLGEVEGLLTGYFEPIVAGRAFRAPNSMSRSTAGRVISSPPATIQPRLPFQIKECASAAATRTMNSCPTTIAPR